MNPYFLESLDLREHPLINAKSKVREGYFAALQYLVNASVIGSEDIKEIYSQTENHKNN